MRRIAIALILSALTVGTSTANPYRFDKRVEMKDNPSWGDRGFRHREFHHQYSQWHNQVGTHCCNVDNEHGDGDCRITKARWNSSAQKWEALVDGEWRFIDADRHVQDDYGVGPEATVCAGPYGTIYCFDPSDGFM